MSQDSVVWDGKDMAAVQMLLHDLREQGVPAAQWFIRADGKTVLHLRMYPRDMLHMIEAGTKIMRFDGGDHLATAYLCFPGDTIAPGRASGG